MNYREANVPCVDEEAAREPESVVELIRKSEDIANCIEETVQVLGSNLFGYGGKEATKDEPRCFRDVCAQHAERMARINAMLSSVKERLGV